MFKVPEKYREYGAKEMGNVGGFSIPHPKIASYNFFVVASDEAEWEHVSVTLYDTSKRGKGVNRCCTWAEMCFIKDQFWDDTDCVMQLHPPKSEHVSMHPFCLHLWRPINEKIPMPPTALVGVKGINIQSNKSRI